MKEFIISSLILFSSCMATKPSNAIEELGEEVIKKKEGIDIQLTPIEEKRDDNKTYKS